MSRKIPQSEWGAIVARREQGEPVSAIARSYGCSPTAIHYIIGRSRNAAAAAAAGGAAAEPAAVQEAESGTETAEGSETAAAPSPDDPLPGAAVQPQPVIETAPERRPQQSDRPLSLDR